MLSYDAFAHGEYRDAANNPAANGCLALLSALLTRLRHSPPARKVPPDWRLSWCVPRKLASNCVERGQSVVELPCRGLRAQ